MDLSNKESGSSIFFDIILFAGFICAGLFLAQFLAIICLIPFHDSLSELMRTLNDPITNSHLKIQILFLSGITSLFSFVISPLIFIKWREKSIPNFLYKKKGSNKFYVFYTIAIMIVSIPFTGSLIEWNESIKLPESLKYFEEWASQKEEYLKNFTKVLTTLNNTFELFIGLIVIAIIPALGEELVFRGYLQNKLEVVFRSSHIAIWTSAFLFSAIHFQFYGFLPRMVLGALFGYIYVLTGMFHLPVIAHFTNNALTLVLLYFNQHKIINYDIDAEQEIPLYLSFISLIMTVVLFISISNISRTDRKNKIFF